MIGVMICLVLCVHACATFNTPAPFHQAAIRGRALTREGNGIRASAAVVGQQEAREIFGLDLSRRNLQAVWLEIENHTDQRLILLPTAIDPEYFSPLEVAYTYRQSFAAEANAALAAHLVNLNFPIRRPIQPGSRVSGYVFTNESQGMKVIDVDLLGHNLSQNFTIFAPNPDSDQGPAILDRMNTMFSASELSNVDSESELRQALERLPCCVSDKDGESSAEPFNVVIIGAFDDWTTAFIRRDYRYQVLTPRYAFGRAQDMSGLKLSRGYTKAQAQTIRVWQTPMVYRGKPVWVGQTSTRLGGRFGAIAPADVTLPLNPYPDEARDDLTQDLAYSQALSKIGYVKGSGLARSSQTAASSHDTPYTTDGLRVVLVFGDRPMSLESIDFFDWERLADYR